MTKCLIKLPKTSGIYTITNKLNGKMYVGYCMNFRKRESEHRNTLINKNHDNEHLQNSILKYGIENFKFEILEECEVQFLSALEHYWATILDVHNRKRGYNIKPTHPDDIKLCAQETRDKISKIHKGRTKSKESIEKMKLTKSKNPKVYTEEESIKHKIKQRNNLGKEIMIFDLEGKLIRIYPSIAEASIDLNIKPISLSGTAILNSKKESDFRKIKNFIAIKVEDYKEGTRVSYKRKYSQNKHARKAVIMLDSDNTIIREFNSMKDAANFLNLKCEGSISQSIKHGYSARGFFFKLK